MMKAQKIENCGPASKDAFGWTIQKGYVYRVFADNDDVWDCSIEHDGAIIEARQFGYHGNDIPPCGADYLYAEEDGSELLVISCESDPTDIDTVDGFYLERVDLEPGDHKHDGAWQFYVLEVNTDDGETILAGTTC